MVLPKFIRHDKSRNILACSILTALLPIILGSLYIYGDDKGKGLGVLIFAIASGVVAVGLFIASFFVKEK